jgi:hypothetical protein
MSNELKYSHCFKLSCSDFFSYIAFTTFLHIYIMSKYIVNGWFSVHGSHGTMSILVSFFSFLYFFRTYFFFTINYPFLCNLFLSALYFPEEGTMGVKNYRSCRLNKKSKSWIWLVGKIKYEKKIATNSYADSQTKKRKAVNISELK